ncbi:MAG: hypothetical protein JNJ88_12215 [Planctomycetes bacterium]|nr:hypothetical protein [Planctomycetota bacterium]
MPFTTLAIRGARENNLRGVDLDLPLGRRIAVTGPSGSGKSSLAFDTIAREGTRQFLEAMALSEPGAARSARARLAALRRSHVDSIEGLPAVVSVRQEDVAIGARSTLGTVAGVSPALRVLVAGFGTLHCPRCEEPQPTTTTAQIAADLLRRRPEQAVRVLGSLPNSDRLRSEEISALAARGMVKLWAVLAQSSREVRLDDGELPAPGETLYGIADRLVVRAEQGSRLLEALELAAEIGQGRIAIAAPDGLEHYATSRACARCATPLPQRSPRLLSTTASPGACEICKGIGTVRPTGDFCEACSGSGLSDLGRSIKLLGHSMSDLQQWEAAELRKRLSELALPDSAAVRELRAEIDERLASLEALGLGSLALGRRASTLSTGELQRARCACIFGARVHNALFVLDEPSVGCHPADRDKLLDSLDLLESRGSSTIVVEHDDVVIESADLVVELGPGGGSHGGRVIYSGPPSGRPRLSAEAPPRPQKDAATTTGGPALRIIGARGHCLRGVDAEFRAGELSVVCGVSGSGKSSLIFGTLGAAARRALGGEATSAEPLLPHDRIEGLEAFDRRVIVGPRLPGRATRSSPATLLGVAGELRELLAATTAAKARGWNASHFTANRTGWRSRDDAALLEGGRCEACAGLGFRELDLELSQPMVLSCSACDGTGFAASTLEVRWRGRNIAQWHQISLEEAASELASVPKIAQALAPALELGLGYLRLGERADGLSGGELRRIQIAKVLGAAVRGKRTLVLLDEPTRGLHGAEVGLLLRALRRLADRGDAVIVVEHHLDVIRAADFVLEMGPGGGAAGGKVVAKGTPENLAAAPSATGRALRAARGGRPPRETHALPAAPIRVVGARTGCLRNVSFELPRTGFHGIVGCAGSGKSTLAFDVLAAEGRRRFLSTLAFAERRALERIDPPQVDAVDGLPATLALRDLPEDVAWGEATGLLPALRQIYGAFGAAVCPRCGIEIRRREPADAANEALTRYRSARARVLIDAEVSAASLPAQWLARGYVRYLKDGQELRWDSAPQPAKPFEVIVDRLVLELDHRERIQEALEECSAVSGGRGTLQILGGDGAELRIAFDRFGGCVQCGFRLPEPIRERDLEADGKPPAPIQFRGRLWRGEKWTFGELRAIVTEHSAGGRAEQSACAALAVRADLASEFVDESELLSARGTTPARRAAWILQGAAQTPRGALVVVEDPTRGLSEPSSRRLTQLLVKLGADRLIVASTNDPICKESVGVGIELGPGAGRCGGEILRAIVGAPAAASPSRKPRKHLVFVSSERELPAEILDTAPPSLPGGAATVAHALEAVGPIGDLLSRTGAARLAGFTAERFDPLTSGSGSGRCGLCRGSGAVALDLDFLPGDVARCPACDGARFEPRTLAVTLYGRSIAGILDLEIGDARTHFADHPRIVDSLSRAASLRLGHLRLGASLSHISSSERARLAGLRAAVTPAGSGPMIWIRALDGLFGPDRDAVLDGIEQIAKDTGRRCFVVDAREACEPNAKPRATRRTKEQSA